MILGYDWLEQFNPMKIHWGAKWLAITYGETAHVIQGLLSEVQTGQIVQIVQLSEEDLKLDTDDTVAV
jgi:hypothetical protein